MLARTLPPVPRRVAFRAHGLTFALGALLWLRHAVAEPASPELPRAPAGDAALLVGGADARGDGTVRLRAVFDYVADPVVVLATDQRTYRVVSRQQWATAGVSVTWAHRFLLALDVPAVLDQAGRAPPPGVTPLEGPERTALGDVRLLGRVRVLGAADSREKLAAGLALSVPTHTSPWSGHGGLQLRPAFNVSVVRERCLLGMEFGYLFRRDVEVRSLLPLRTGQAVTLGVAAAVAVDARSTVTVGPELAVALGTGTGTSLFDARSSSGAFLFTGRYVPSLGPFGVTLGFGPGLGQGVGAADARALLALTYSPEAPPPPPDSDADRVADGVDACPSVRGVANEDPLMNGCPELPTDSDGDAIPDVLDACPRRPGPAHAERRLHGCPLSLDSDADGFVDALDGCPREPGAASAEPARNGCPPRRVPLVDTRIEITAQIQFETGTAALRPASTPILEEVRKALVERPEIRKVEIQGHTDATAGEAVNRELSEQRARTVLDWLVAHGVDAQRLTAKGYAAERPIADDATPDGRAKNRRVEFHVLELADGATP